MKTSYKHENTHLCRSCHISYQPGKVYIDGSSWNKRENKVQIKYDAIQEFSCKVKLQSEFRTCKKKSKALISLFYSCSISITFLYAKCMHSLVPQCKKKKKAKRQKKLIASHVLPGSYFRTGSLMLTM